MSQHVWLCNVFTTAMLNPSVSHTYRFEPINIEQARVILGNGFRQAVGHPATCEVLSQQLGMDVIPERANVTLGGGQVLVVAQVVVPRLAEGEVLSKEQVSTLPVAFWLVSES